MSQQSRQFIEAVMAFDAVVRRTPDAAWQNETPCEGWNALDLLQHQCAVLNGVQQVAATGEMAKPSPPQDMTDPQAVWAQTRDDLLEVLDRKGVLAQQGPFWFGAETVNDMIGVVMWDAATHAWDLGQAVGVDPHLSDELLQACYDAVAPMSDMLVETQRTGPVVGVADDAPILDRYLGLVGRRPAG